MARRKKTEPVGPPKGWIVSDEYQISPQVVLEKGDECKIKGEQGKYKFVRHVVNTNLDPHAEWVDLWGGTANYAQLRSVHVDKLAHIPKRRSSKRKNPTR
jgi:hypothetical protein